MTADRWLAFVAVLTVALALPGPDFAVVLRHGLRSTRAGAAAAAGVLTGLLAHGCLAAAGLSALVAAHPGLLVALRLVGTAYLGGLGVAALLAWRRSRLHPADHDGPALPAAGGGGAYRDGALTNLLNPKALLFFLGVIPHFLTRYSGVSATILLLGGTTVVVAALWYGLMLATLAQVQRLLDLPGARSGVDAVTGVALLTVAGSLALS